MRRDGDAVKWTRRVYGRWTLGDPGDGGQFY
jgi:hypothetical protein